jgi:hypothetical protein
MRLEDGRREQSRRSWSDARLLVVGLATIGIVGGLLLYFSTPIADALSHYLMKM